MTNRGAPRDGNYQAVTTLMAKGGKLLTGYRKDMVRSANRVKTKLPHDKNGEYTRDSITDSENCSSRQKRLVLYHKLYHFLYGIGRKSVRIVLPSCCVLRIQTEFPDPVEPAFIEESFIEDTVVNGLVDIPVEINVPVENGGGQMCLFCIALLMYMFL